MNKSINKLTDCLPMGEFDVFIPDISSHRPQTHEVVSHYGLTFAACEEVLLIENTLKILAVFNAELLQLTAQLWDQTLSKSYLLCTLE